MEAPPAGLHQPAVQPSQAVCADASANVTGGRTRRTWFRRSLLGTGAHARTDLVPSYHTCTCTCRTARPSVQLHLHSAARTYVLCWQRSANRNLATTTWLTDWLADSREAQDHGTSYHCSEVNVRSKDKPELSINSYLLLATALQELPAKSAAGAGLPLRPSYRESLFDSQSHNGCRP